MGVLGGTLGYRLLKAIAPAGAGLHAMDGRAYAGKSKLRVLLGEEFMRHIPGAVVIDFGCGGGTEAVEMAQVGARQVVGIDNQEVCLVEGRQRAAEAGVADRVSFTSGSAGPADVIVSLDSFEHFEDPGAVLSAMHSMLRPGGLVVTSFGPTWYHPLGGHLFSVFPWSHLVFTERALIRWRSDFKSDGATRFGEVAGGLNRMTIARFLRLVRQSPFELVSLELVPIRRLAWAANRLTREVTTAIVRATLRKPGNDPRAS